MLPCDHASVSSDILCHNNKQFYIVSNQGLFLVLGFFCRMNIEGIVHLFSRPSPVPRKWPLPVSRLSLGAVAGNVSRPTTDKTMSTRIPIVVSSTIRTTPWISGLTGCAPFSCLVFNFTSKGT